MSIQAITWALEDAPDVPARLVSTLIALASYANGSGRGAFPGNDTLAEHTRKSIRQVKRDLEELVELKLISDGDQRLVAHKRADRRPRVWDLAMDRKRSRGDTDVTPQEQNGVSTASPRDHDRGDTDDTPQEPRGDTQGRHGVTLVSNTNIYGSEPKDEPNPPPTPRVDDPPPARAHTRARPSHVPVADLVGTAHSVGAWKLVTPWRRNHTSQYRYSTYREIAKEVDGILADGGIPDLIIVALHDWDSRGKNPSFLRHCYDDAVHATKPVHLRPVSDNRPSTTDTRVAGALELAARYEAQERATEQFPQQALPGVAS